MITTVFIGFWTFLDLHFPCKIHGTFLQDKDEKLQKQLKEEVPKFSRSKDFRGIPNIPFLDNPLVFKPLLLVCYLGHGQRFVSQLLLMQSMCFCYAYFG